jgi:hypothetical protein
MRAATVGILWVAAILAGCDGDTTGSPSPAARTYTVGGTVSGLTGSVALANNGSDARTVSSNGGFTFATALPRGAAYNVTITGHPANQTCTVTNGSGTVATANVTSIVVTCVTNGGITVGGTVTGLASTGLVLQNNGGDDLPRATNGTFTFPTSLSSGAGYSVTVLSQPVGQTCTVGNGTGTASANVTNVAIDCQANTYSIGGTVTGLRGSGLVLQNNGGNNTPRAADGAFTFTTSIAYGTTYNVTVLTQPSGPAQVCTVTNGSGTVTGTVTNVLVNCPAAPAFTQQPANQSVVAPAGATFAVVASGNPAPSLQWQVSTDSGSTWNNIAGATANAYSTPATTTTDSGKRFRAIATNGSGTVTSSVAVLTVTAPPSGKSWSAPVLISETNGAYDAFSTRIAVNAQGDAVVAWQKADSTGNNIWANIYRAGSGWLGAQRISSGSLGTVDSGRPAVAISANGTAVVVWESTTTFVVFPRDARTDIRSNFYLPGTGWGSDTLVETDDGASPFWHSMDRPRVTISNNGIALAAWNYGDGQSLNANSVMYATGSAGGWAATQILATGNAGGVSLAGNGNGTVVATWSQFVGGRFRVGAARGSTGGFSAPGFLDSDTTDTALPAVTINAAGEAVAAWYVPGSQKVMGARTVSGAWLGDVRLSATFDPVVTSVDLILQMDASGNALVQWGNYIARLTNGSWFQGQPYLSAAASGLQVALNSAGQSLTIWASLVSPNQLYGARDYGVGSSDATPVNSTRAYEPQLVLDELGNGIAIWKQADGTANRLWSSLYR